MLVGKRKRASVIDANFPIYPYLTVLCEIDSAECKTHNILSIQTILLIKLTHINSVLLNFYLELLQISLYEEYDESIK